MAVIKLYQKELEEIKHICGGGFKPLYSYMVGPLSVYMKAYARKGRQLVIDFVFMENLKAGHPALLWHRFKTTNPKAKSGGQIITYQNILRICNAIRTFDAEETMQVYQPSKEAREWLANQDKATKSQMKEILGL